MNKKCDVSTSTEDVTGRPLCLFYFTHPFGVLSPEPPTITAAPPNIARTFINMEPVPSWSNSTPSYQTISSTPSFDLGNAQVHKNPILRNYSLDYRRDSLSSSLFSSDMWFSSSGGSRKCDERRALPYTRTLPPLELAVTRELCFDFNRDDLWPKKCMIPGKLSLPPIEMPSVVRDYDIVPENKKAKVLGVRKPRKRVPRSGLRRIMTHLLRRHVHGITCYLANDGCKQKTSFKNRIKLHPDSDARRLLSTNCLQAIQLECETLN